MKKVLLLIVVPVLLVTLGFAQTPPASIHTDQTNIKGCLRGTDGNYTVVEDNTGRTFRVTGSVDLKSHLGHNVTLVGQKASGASAADNSFAVTELNMISDHCGAAPAAIVTGAPTTTVSTPADTTIAPVAVASTPAASISTPAETTVTPTATATLPAATTVTPTVAVTPPAQTAVTPAVPPTATVSTPPEAATVPAAAATQSTKPPARPKKSSPTPAPATTKPAATASTASETVSAPAPAATTPDATANPAPDTASTAAPKPAAPAKSGSLWLLISFIVLVVVMGTLFPFLNRWRKRKALERTGEPNLSFTHEASSDKDESDRPSKAA